MRRPTVKSPRACVQSGQWYAFICRGLRRARLADYTGRSYPSVAAGPLRGGAAGRTGETAGSPLVSVLAAMGNG